MITAIILAHYKEREKNLSIIVDQLLAGSVKPSQIVIFIDNPEIKYQDDRATIVTSTTSFLPKIRFALGSYFDTKYCFFIDDDLVVKPRTLENFMDYASENKILGLEGSILGNTPNPYADDECINRGQFKVPGEVDIIIRTYFVPTKLITAGLRLQAMYPELPRVSLDDVYLCLGNKYLNNKKNIVIPVEGDSNLGELFDGGVGQSREGIHYENRNKVCRFLMDRYE